MSSSKKRHGGHLTSKADKDRDRDTKQQLTLSFADSDAASDSGADLTDRTLDPSASEAAPAPIDPFFVEPEEMAVVEAIDLIVDRVLEHVEARSVDERVVSYAVSWARKEMEDILSSIFLSRDEGEGLAPTDVRDEDNEIEAKLPWRPDADMESMVPDSWARGTVPVRRRVVNVHRRTGGLGVPGEKAPSVVMSQRSLSRSRASNYQRRATQHAASIAAAMQGGGGEVARGETVFSEEAKAARKEEDANATSERRAVRKQAEARKRAIEDRIKRERRAKEEHERSIRLMKELASSDYTLDHNGNVVFVSRVDPDKLPATRVHVEAKVVSSGAGESGAGGAASEAGTAGAGEGGKGKSRRKKHGARDKGKDGFGKSQSGRGPEDEDPDKEKEREKEKSGRTRREKTKAGMPRSITKDERDRDRERVPVVRVGKRRPDAKDERPRDYQPSATAGSLVSSMRVANGVSVYDGARRAGAGASGAGAGASSNAGPSPAKRKDDGGRVHVTKREYDAFVDAQNALFQSGRDLDSDEVERVTSLSASLNLPASIASAQRSDSGYDGGGGGGVASAIRARLPPSQFAPTGTGAASPAGARKELLPRIAVPSNRH